MAILGTNVWYSKVVNSKKSWEIEFIIELLWFCVVDAGLDSWNNLREILDERWLGDLGPKVSRRNSAPIHFSKCVLKTYTRRFITEIRFFARWVRYFKWTWVFSVKKKLRKMISDYSKKTFSQIILANSWSINV